MMCVWVRVCGCLSACECDVDAVTRILVKDRLVLVVALVQAERFIARRLALVVLAHVGERFRLGGGIALGQFGDQHVPVSCATLQREAHLREHTLDGTLERREAEHHDGSGGHKTPAKPWFGKHSRLTLAVSLSSVRSPSRILEI